MFTMPRSLFLNLKNRIFDYSYDSVLGLVNAVPSLAGFSVLKEKIAAPFWILFLPQLTYVYGVGSLVYQLQYAHGPGDFIKSYVNISIMIQIFSMSYWFLRTRPLLKSVLSTTKESDELAKQSPLFRQKYVRYLSMTKRIILVFYGINLTNQFTIYMPNRVDLGDDFGMAMKPCVGMDPLTVSPNREICVFLLSTQEITIMVVALNYQALLLFLINHTAAMYRLLGEELMTLNHVTDRSEVKEKLILFIYRHILIVNVVSKLKRLYSSPLGVNFASNAICIALFFYLPIEEWVMFLPIMMYCFLVFFLYCALCQNLVNAAEVFERAVYSCGWENFAVNEMKMVYVMLMQSQHKVEVLAADIVPVNIYTFAVTLRFMFKFVTVMKF